MAEQGHPGPHLELGRVQMGFLRMGHSIGYGPRGVVLSAGGIEMGEQAYQARSECKVLCHGWKWMTGRGWGHQIKLLLPLYL